ncbi:hypothetical protein MXB_1173 [Myxobolus squamalis]|nr:hypothetical protein MXB_1173 [Myxobolus squamalis]
MAKIADLNKKVNENPSDINSWLELVELQREKLGLNCSDKILAECQMAVLSKAITRNPKSEDLLLRELYITHNVSDSNSLREALDKIVFNFPNKITFWLMLIFHTSVLLTFLTLARYLLGTDNFEKLIALFQILLEYNLAQTIDTELEKMKPDACLLYLETFWDSETMKIGEKGALGFSHFFSKNKKPNQASIFSSERISVFNDILVDIVPDENFYTDIEANIVRNINGVDTGWLAIETYRSSYQMLPLKTNQDVDDNERIILFDDVSSFVFKLDKCVHFELCLLFLLLLGVPIPHKLVPILNQDLADGLIISDFVLQFPQLLSQFETILGGYNLYMRKVLSPIWLHFGCDNPTSTVPIDISCLKFIRNLFVQLLSLTNFNNVQRQSLSIIWLQFEILIALTSPSNENRNFEKVLNLSKKLLELEENRNYPAIWILYSFCLIYYGETKQYIQTMLKLIKFYNSLPSNTENNEIKGILIRFLVENVFLNDLFDTMDKNQAIDLIRSHIEKILKINYTSPLDINKSIIQMMSNINETNLMQFSNIIICQFLHTLLCFNPNIAISNFIKWIEYCSKRCQIEDSLSIDLKSYSYLTIKYDVKSSFYLLCRLISEHFSLIVCHPRMYSHIDHCKLNEIIHVCICMFPLSISLHQWFYRYNQTVSMANSFRLYFDHAQVSFLETTSIPQLSCWIFHIYTEISYLLRIIKPQEQNCNMLIKNSSSANRLRSLFEKVCSHPSYRFRPLIWRLYMRTLKILNDDEAVKSVFYRALQHTPWCKVYINYC